MATVAVFGAAGFIGHHVSLELALRGGHTVQRYDRRDGVGPVLDLDVAVPEAQPGDIAIHAAEPGVATDPQHAERCLARLRNVLAAPFARVIYVSSAVVYGDEADTPRTEDSPLDPRGTYALAKSAVEEEAARDPRCTIARLANIYGKGMATTNVLSDIIAQAIGTEPLRLRDLAPVRDYVHVDDVARGLVALVEHPVWGVFNLGCGRGTSVERLARIACEAAGQPDRIIEATQPSGRASYLVLDPSKAHREIGWQPTITIESGLTSLVREIAK